MSEKFKCFLCCDLEYDSKIEHIRLHEQVFKHNKKVIFDDGKNYFQNWFITKRNFLRRGINPYSILKKWTLSV